jgi:thiol-disulfide isomerase/thioredoxin
MKKTVLIAAAAALVSGSAMAQLPDNSICPDWTGTDINGNSYNLYSLLDSGYTVFIDVSATWCGPCWSYHNTGNLEDLYTEYGPGTAENKVRVFMIEGDGSTTMSDLQGNTGQSQGDWITGTPYPIIDNASIADLLEITYFPTIYMVCPNRIITEPGQADTSELWGGVGSCPVAESANDATLLPSMESAGGCAGTEVTLRARLQNMGTSPLTSATIEARQGSTVLGSVNWTGDLDTYEVEYVDVTTYTPTASSNVTLEVTSSDDNMDNNSGTLFVQASTTMAASTHVTMEMKTDQYGSETSWKLFKPDGTVFAQGGPYAGNTVYNYTWDLQDLSCYRLEFYDLYGDGICCAFGQGYYKVFANGAIVLQGGSFGALDKKFFRTDNAAGIEDNQLDHSLSVYPNPSNGKVQLEYSLEQGTAVNAVITDLAGQIVMSRNFGPTSGIQRQTLDLGNLSNGMYLLKVEAGNLRVVCSISLNK